MQTLVAWFANHSVVENANKIQVLSFFFFTSRLTASYVYKILLILLLLSSSVHYNIYEYTVLQRLATVHANVVLLTTYIAQASPCTTLYWEIVTQIYY